MKKPMVIKVCKVWQGADGQWYYHGVSAANGKTVVPSQGYSSRQKAEQTRARLEGATFALDD